MLHNLSLRNVVISIGFLKLLIWSSAHSKIITSIPVNGSSGFKGFFTSDFINLDNLWIKGYIFISVLIVSYLNSSKLWS